MECGPTRMGSGNGCTRHHLIPPGFRSRRYFCHFPFWEDNGNDLLVLCYSLGLLARHLLPNCSILCSTGNVAKVTLIPFRLCVFACECVHNTPWNVPEDTTRDRFVWDLILWFSKQSMESMPALCASVWIMMNGPLPLNGAAKNVSFVTLHRQNS